MAAPGAATPRRRASTPTSRTNALKLESSSDWSASGKLLGRTICFRPTGFAVLGDRETTPEGGLNKSAVPDVDRSRAMTHVAESLCVRQLARPRIPAPLPCLAAEVAATFGRKNRLKDRPRAHAYSHPSLRGSGRASCWGATLGANCSRSLVWRQPPRGLKHQAQMLVAILRCATDRRAAVTLILPCRI
jgi:hypothetical protein